jgi:mannose-6-phosphate isomerase
MQLDEWLREHALPFWDRHGVDRTGEGFFEDIQLGLDHTPVGSGELRRGRVVARQIYVFEVGRRMGWRSPLSSPIDHGCDYLFRRMHLGDGLFNTAVAADTHVPHANFSLYEHAFYLFALAQIHESQAGRHPVATTAARCLEQLRGRWGKSNGGFNESVPATLPLKSNPHMHLLEAALAWIGCSAGTDQQRWIALAAELVDLCLTRFIDSNSGAVREYFDADWLPVSGPLGRIVEPGHQFEWAWLLTQWSSTIHCVAGERQACLRAAQRLLELGERYGVDPHRGIAVNEIWDDMSIKDADGKIWPQTERVKAWCAALDQATASPAAEHAYRGVLAAARGLARYFREDTPGTWHEVCGADGRFRVGACKASSLYHVVCAIDVLSRTVDRHRTRILYDHH